MNRKAFMDSLAKEGVFQSPSLYVVGTPIGNLGDLSFRALAAFKKANRICAEDTRVTQKLLKAYGISTKLVSLRAQNEALMTEKICGWLAQGEMIVQVSDAGTPGICDPGSYLVKRVRQAGFSVYSIPGPSALITALSISGISTQQFFFEGFLPAKSSHRIKVLEKIASKNEVTLCYEVPHRILSTLTYAMSLMPHRKLVLLRELTKTFETVLEGNAASLKEMIVADSQQQRGEMVLIFDQAEMTFTPALTQSVKEVAQELVAYKIPSKTITQLLANLVPVDKAELYEFIVALKKAGVK
ncbi:MAG: 16S rRNA (cytidine(1402)-2'-O)-methyltransferase [Neisseriaceae bacterium]